MTDKQIPLQKHLRIVSDVKRKLDEARAERDEALAQAAHWRSLNILSTIDGKIEEIEKQARAKAFEKVIHALETNWHQVDPPTLVRRMLKDKPPTLR